MKEIIGTLYEMEGLNKDSARERGEKIFEQLDINGDGSWLRRSLSKDVSLMMTYLILLIAVKE